MPFRYIDIPESAHKTIFEPTTANFFIQRSGGNGLTLSTLFETDTPLRDEGFLLKYFEMGYTNLWLWECTHLLQAGKWVKIGEDAPVHSAYHAIRFGLFKEDGAYLIDYWDAHRQNHYFDTAQSVQDYTQKNPSAAPKLEGMVIARFLLDIFWH
jgi:hypothetical protein